VIAASLVFRMLSIFKRGFVRVRTLPLATPPLFSLVDPRI